MDPRGRARGDRRHTHHRHQARARAVQRRLIAVPATGAIAAGLGRRDEFPPSDQINVGCDTRHDHLTAYVFQANPSAVQGDFFFYDDDRVDRDYDAVWDVRTSNDEKGWIAEYRIPFSQMRFDEAPEARSARGFGVRRNIASEAWNNEELVFIQQFTQSLSMQFRNFWFLGAGLTRDFETLDDLDTRGGPSIVNPAGTLVFAEARSDTRRSWRLNSGAIRFTDAVGSDTAGVSVGLTVQPSGRIRRQRPCATKPTRTSRSGSRTGTSPRTASWSVPSACSAAYRVLKSAVTDVARAQHGVSALAAESHAVREIAAGMETEAGT